MREAKAAAARGIEERRSGETGHVATERFPAHQKNINDASMVLRAPLWVVEQWWVEEAKI